MNYHINKDQNKSAYMQLYTQIRADIVSGAYPGGTKLPSKRVVADETGVSVITVEHAYAILCEEGYIEPRERSGYYAAYSQQDIFATDEPETELPSVSVPASVADDMFRFSVLTKVMRRVLADYGERLLIKSPNKGCAELRGALSAYLARSRGIHVSPEQIVIGSGAEYMYGLIVQLLGKERTVALESPSYGKIRQVYLANGVDCEMLKLGRDGIKTGELEKTKATVLHVTPYNSFPSGVTATASKRNEYIRWAQRRGGYIVEDDYCSEFTVSTKVEDTLFSLLPDGGVIYLNTFSKTIAPSMRAGYMVLSPALAERFQADVGFYSCTVPVFEQYVLAELINSGDFERHINRVRRNRRKALNA